VQQARVLAAMGALRHEFLLPEERAYDPGSHYERVKGQGDFPVLTPAMRVLDSLVVPAPVDRAVRDPAGQLGTTSTTLGVPVTPAQEQPTP
jgi:hypothetical protein